MRYVMLADNVYFAKENGEDRVEECFDGEVEQLLHFGYEDVYHEEYGCECNMPWCNIWEDVEEYLYRTVESRMVEAIVIIMCGE